MTGLWEATRECSLATMLNVARELTKFVNFTDECLFVARTNESVHRIVQIWNVLHWYCGVSVLIIKPIDVGLDVKNVDASMRCLGCPYDFVTAAFRAEILVDASHDVLFLKLLVCW